MLFWVLLVSSVGNCFHPSLFTNAPCLMLKMASTHLQSDKNSQREFRAAINPQRQDGINSQNRKSLSRSLDICEFLSRYTDVMQDKCFCHSLYKPFL